MTDFTEPTGFARDLAHLGAYYRDYRRLMAHWREVLPLPVLDVDYEALVGGQEEQSRRMVAFLGLDWEPACLEFHRSARPVLTASAEQVRKPIHAGSIGRARAYQAHLGPLIAALDGADDFPAGNNALD